MSYPRTEVVYQRVDGTEYVVTDPVQGAAIQPADWQATDDEVQYDVWIRTHLSASSIHNSAKNRVTLYSAATGGTVTTFTGDGTNGTDGVQYRVHTFSSDGDFVLRYPRTVEHLLVAGGGGGGTRHGGGGGAGGVLSGSGARSADTYPIVVGSGGRQFVAYTGTAANLPAQNLRAASGGNSSAFGLSAIGGGRGGSGAAAGGPESGGSGGGAESSSVSAGSGTTNQGTSGGAGSNSYWSGGGGGGASTAGSNSTPTGNVSGGAGGDGVASSITGTAVTYGGGGGGSTEGTQAGTSGKGGSGGGGTGGKFGWRLYSVSSSVSSPENTSQMDSLISGATSVSQGSREITTQSNTTGVNVLNWANNDELATATGATAPNNGINYALVVNGTFVPTESGTYTFTIAGDDAVDLLIDGTLVTSHYGNHGMGDLGVNTGTRSLTAGQTYRFLARQQQGGWGLAGLRVFWRKPSQTTGWHHDASELTANGRNGTDGLGGGGGAGGHENTTNSASGRGGNGVVIVRYPVRVTPA